MASPDSAVATAPPAGNGLPLALGAYAIWGLLPLYLRFVHDVPAHEFVGWRVVFTLPVCLILVIATRQLGDMREVLRHPGRLAALGLSALLMGANWAIYVAAVHDGHVLASSLGYFINPLANVLLGTTFLGERLNRIQWLSVAVAVAGVGVLAFEALDTLWISLALVATFSGYGLVRKLVTVPAITGLTFESLTLLPLAMLVLAWQAGLGQSGPGAGVSLGGDPATTALLVASGPITAIPLMMFASAVRRMDFVTIGFVQFLAPSLVFIQGLWLFHEPLGTTQLACFGLIWTACGIYCWDLIARVRARQTA